MKFLVDENLPPRLAIWLCEQGHDAVHVQKLSLLGASDSDVAAAALAEDRIIVTRESDFVASPTAPRVLILTIGNAKTAELIVWLDPRLAQAIARLDSGEAVVKL